MSPMQLPGPLFSCVLWKDDAPTGETVGRAFMVKLTNLFNF